MVSQKSQYFLGITFFSLTPRKLIKSGSIIDDTCHGVTNFSHLKVFSLRPSLTTGVLQTPQKVFHPCVIPISKLDGINYHPEVPNSPWQSIQAQTIAIPLEKHTVQIGISHDILIACSVELRFFWVMKSTIKQSTKKKGAQAFMQPSKQLGGSGV